MASENQDSQHGRIDRPRACSQQRNRVRAADLCPAFRGLDRQDQDQLDKDYCYSKNPGEDYFHLLLCGEVYLENGEERLCLNCAVRRSVATDDRLYWQRGARRAPPPAF